MNKKPKVLFFDIETSPLQAWVWHCGKQYVNHKQLVDSYNRYGIICITYCWNDGKKAQSIDWGYYDQDTAKVVEEFDKIVAQADHIIGKNSDRFDIKMINAARMLNGLPGFPEWALSTDDLEKQMRRHFRLPSQSLDYISNQLGLGGKIKMEFQDWIDICELNKNGEKALAKMIKYGKKDVEDTRKLWNMLSEHFTKLRFPINTYNKHVNNNISPACQHCGSTNLTKRGYSYRNKSTYQEYRCKDCRCYAGSFLVKL